MKPPTEKPKRKALATKGWLVPYRVTYDGEAYVLADTAAEAEEMIERGSFDDDACQERVDWERRGRAKGDE